MKSSSGSVALCYGTRPQVIKASVLRSALGRCCTLHTIDTGQHYDYALNELLYSELGVSRPDLFLEVGSGTQAAQIGAILVRCEKALKTVRPDAVVVIGDTNSTLGAALSAVKLRIPVVHVEAGLRALDDLMPEEINRRVVDSVAQVLCAPSHRAAEALRRERPTARVEVTGDVARDVLIGQLACLPSAGSLVGGGCPSPYIYCTLHRAALTDDPTLLREVLTALGRLAIATVLPMHPRTLAALGSPDHFEEFGPGLRVLPPVGYRESLALTRGAKAVITDSGGVQRESYWLGVPCVTLRSETEWIETVACGANHLLPPSLALHHLAPLLDDLLSSDDSAKEWNRDAYGIGDSAVRIASIVSDVLNG
jgi:UDP-N-acetylglucosamine 2-epimerase